MINRLIKALLARFRRQKPALVMQEEYQPVPISKDFPVTILRKG